MCKHDAQWEVPHAGSRHPGQASYRTDPWADLCNLFYGPRPLFMGIAICLTNCTDLPKDRSDSWPDWLCGGQPGASMWNFPLGIMFTH